MPFNKQLGMPKYARQIADPVDIETLLNLRKGLTPQDVALQRWLDDLLGNQPGPRVSLTPYNQWPEGTHPLVKMLYEELQNQRMTGVE